MISFFQVTPDLHLHHLVWADDKSGDGWDIYYKNLVSGEVVNITEGLPPLPNQYPTVSESYIAWVSGDVLWSRQVPGAPPPMPTPTPDPPPVPDPVGLTVKISAKYSAKKKGN